MPVVRIPSDSRKPTASSVSSRVHRSVTSGVIQYDVIGSSKQQVDDASTYCRNFKYEHIFFRSQGNYNITNQGQERVMTERKSEEEMTFSLKNGPPKSRKFWQNSPGERICHEEVEVHGRTDCLCSEAGGDALRSRKLSGRWHFGSDLL